MKKALFFALAGTAAASAGLILSSADAAQLPSPTAWGVVARGANHNTWERTEYELAPDGTVRPRTGRYMELATGLNFKDKNGKWTPSKEVIDLLPDGSAAALSGGTKVWFSSDISQGAVTVETPDGLMLRDEPVALVMEDGKNSVIIGVITNSVGELAAANEVVYPNAFEGVGASVEYVYRLSGLEQDVVLQSQLPDPQSLGLSASARVEVVSEFWTTNEPEETVGAVDAESGLSDTTLKFGGTVFVPGRAYTASAGAAVGGGFHRGGARVYKNWLDVPEADGSTAHFLVEELPYSKVAPMLEGLPAVSKAGGMKGAELARGRTLKGLLGRLGKRGSEVTVVPGGGKPKVAFRDLLGAPRAVSYDKKGSSETRHLVSYDKRGGSETCHLVSYVNERPGVVLDYQTVSGSPTNYDFQSDLTYLVSSYFYIYGTTILEGGAVIKASTNGQVVIDQKGMVDCQTGPYRPCVFTSFNNNTVGENISGSSGNPNFQDVSLPFLTINATNADLHDLHFSYGWQGVQYGSGPATFDLRDCEFMDVIAPVYADYIGLYNDLIGYSTDEVSQVISQGDPEIWVDGGLTAENVTSDSGYGFIWADYAGEVMALTNCLITSQVITNGVGSTVETNAVVYLPSPSVPVYQTVGAGSHYLTNGSPYRNAGTTNIDPILLADLQTRTTQPPMVYASTSFTTPTTFSPDVPRDTNAAPDLGFHYCALDYVFSSVGASSGLTFTAGTAVGWYDTSTSPGYGIMLYQNGSATFNGTATEPCWLARYDTVQEGGNGNWKAVGWGFGICGNWSGANTGPGVPTLTMNFLKGSSRNFNDDLFRDDGGNFVVTGRNCEFYGEFGGFNMAETFTNCLFYRMPPYINCGSGANGSPSLEMQNCTVEGGNFNALTIQHQGGTWPVTMVDCAFDGTSFSLDTTNELTCDYDAFVTNAPEPPLVGAHDVIVTNYNWQGSWFGDFYLPDDAPAQDGTLLIDKGDVGANAVGLYHFTTQVSQTVEGDSTVDIGYHYVATDQYGNPLDTNGDGTPDYIEDANGNGIYDAGDLGDWVLGPYNGLTYAKGLLVFTPLR
ncbi:MAG: hypothetical protein KGJ88_11100 [Verrucomicrobiota bacterium]|nr:hypothetical protein [Verrucomicrobiota bacterium]